MRQRTSAKSKLVIRRETLRQLRQLTDEELQAAAGGQRTNPTAEPRPSLSGC